MRPSTTSEEDRPVDDAWFDALARRLGTVRSRRSALRVLATAGGGFAGLSATRAGAQGWCAGTGMWCTPLSPCCAGECFPVVGAFGGVCVDPLALAAAADGTGEDGPTKRQRRKQKRREKRRRRGRDGGRIGASATCGTAGAACDAALGYAPCCSGYACDAAGVCAATG
jgi:hypothetical protein